MALCAFLTACTIPSTNDPAPAPVSDGDTLASLGLSASDAFGPDTAVFPGGAKIIALDEAKARLALGRPDFVSANRTASVDAAFVAQKQTDDQTLADYVAAHPDPVLQALVDAKPAYDARTRLRTDGNVDFDAMKVDGTSSTVITMGEDNRRHVLASVIRDGYARANRENVYRAVFQSLPSMPGSSLPAPESLGSMSDGALDLALDQLGRYAASAAAATAPAAVTASTYEYCGKEDSGLTSSPESTFVHDANGLYALVPWQNKDRMTCVRDQGWRGTCPAFSTTSALEMYTAMNTGTRYDLSEQDLYAQYKRSVGEWKTDGAWPDSLTMLLGLQGYAAPREADWTYNTAWNTSPTDASPFHGACTGYDGPCSETAHETPIDCFRVGGLSFCYWAPPEVHGVAQMPFDFSRPMLRVETSLLSRTTAINLAIWLLASGERQVIMAFTVADAFEQVGSSGFLSPTLGGDHGGHATHVVGWVANANLPSTVAPGSGGGYFILKNSWGRERGDQGYYYVPAAWMATYVIDVVAL